MATQRYNMHAGQWEETHAVVSGESLSRIAAHFHSRGWTDLVDWRPIFRLTRERTGLWRDKHKPRQLDQPDLIHPGDLVVIPRSRSGYQMMIQRTESLLRDIIRAPHYAEELQKQEKHFSEGLNLSSDVLVFIATAGASAATAANNAKLAKLAVGHAAKEALKKKTLSAIEMGLKITEYGAKSTGHENVATKARQAARVVHIVDLGHDAKDFRHEFKELHFKKEYWRLAGETVGRVVDYIDVALEWTKPSTLSKGMIRLFTGNDLDAMLARNAEHEKRSREHYSVLLRTKISNLHHEMQIVYSGK